MGVRHEVLNAKNHEREAVHRGAGGAQGRGHGLHQHGRPRYRHSAGRQRRVHDQGRVPEAEDRRAAARGAGAVRRRRALLLLHAQRAVLPRAPRMWDEIFAELQGRRPTRSTTKWSGWAGCTSWAPSATNPAASTTSLRGRAGPPGRPRQLALLPLPAGRPAAHLRRRAHAEPDAAARHGRGRADRVQADHQAHRRRRRPSKRRTSKPANTCSNTTT